MFAAVSYKEGGESFRDESVLAGWPEGQNDKRLCVFSVAVNHYGGG